MSILIKSGDKFFEISDDVLEKCEISKEQFEKGREEVSADVEGQGITVVPRPVGYGASCGKAPCP